MGDVMGWSPRPRYDPTRNQWTLEYRRRRHYLCAGLDNEAHAWSLAAAILGDESLGPVPIAVGEAIGLWLLDHPSAFHREQTIPWFKYVGHKPLAALPPDHLEQYRDWLKRRGYAVPVRRGKKVVADRRQYAAQTIRHRVSAARQVLELAQRRGWITVVPPMPKMDRSSVTPEHYDHDELAAAWSTLPVTTKRILTFIVTTGCRPSEAIRLRWEQVKPARGPHGECVIREHKTRGRTGKARVLVLTAGAANVLAEIGPRRTGPVFLSAKGAPYAGAGSLRSTLRRRGLLSVYRLRHTFAQSLIDAGADVLDVSEFLGHRDLRMALRYVTARSERLHRVAATATSPLSARDSDATTPATHPGPGASAAAPTTPAPKRQRNRGRSAKARLAGA